MQSPFLFSGHSATKVAGVILLAVMLSCLILAGCIQHRFLTKINLDGSAAHTYEASGDSSDLYDNKITLPSGFWWKVETETSQDTSGRTTYTYRAKLNVPSVRQIPDIYDPEVVRYPEILLRHPIRLERYDALLGVLFLYRQTFINRQKDLKYGNTWDFIDPACQVLMNDSTADSLPKEEKDRLQALYLDGLITWSRQMIHRRCQDVLKRDLELHPEIDFSAEQIQNAEQSAESYILRWAPEDSGMSIMLGQDDLWESVGKPAMTILSEQLKYIGDSSFQADLMTLSDLYQWEYEITKDLEDDDFQVKVILPGFILHDNATQKSGDTLSWEFSGKDFYNEDVRIKAQTLYIRWMPTSLAILVLLTIIIYLIRRSSRRKAGINA